MTRVSYSKNSKKKCFHLKADKGNKAEFIDETHYYRGVNILRASGPYANLFRNTLPKMVSEVKHYLKQCQNLVPPR